MVHGKPGPNSIAAAATSSKMPITIRPTIPPIGKSKDAGSRWVAGVNARCAVSLPSFTALRPAAPFYAQKPPIGFVFS